MADHVWNLRSERSFRVIDRAVRGAQRSGAFRVVHFSVQGNHFHGIVEADDDRSFESGMRSLTLRLARGLNAMMGRKGPVLADRFHAHVLRTPAEVRNAIRYVLGNFESHAVRRGALASVSDWVDPFSSASGKVAREAQGSLFPEPATTGPRGWLLRQGVRRAR
jgi:REP element-mobilizing transposase RayT